MRQLRRRGQAIGAAFARPRPDRPRQMRYLDSFCAAA
jgi:hypothetical protein